jgi:hypothetical protein
MTLQQVIDCDYKEFIGQSSVKHNGDYRMLWKIGDTCYTIKANVYTKMCELV